MMSPKPCFIKMVNQKNPCKSGACEHLCLQSTGFYDRIIIGYLYPIITRDFLGDGVPNVPEI